MAGDLDHVRWIGGPPDSGKTTVARMLAEQYDGVWYRMDQFEREHLQRADPVRHPLNAALCQSVIRDETGFFERWVQDDPHILAEQATAIWVERIDLVVDDLRALARDR